MSLNHMLGCGQEATTKETIPIRADNIGQINGADSVSAIIARGPQPQALLCGRTSGGDVVPFEISLSGQLYFTS